MAPKIIFKDSLSGVNTAGHRGLARTPPKAYAAPLRKGLYLPSGRPARERVPLVKRPRPVQPQEINWAL